MMAAPASDFVTVCALVDLPEGQPRAFEIGGDDGTVCVVKSRGAVRAFNDKCPHRGHPLSEGACDGAFLRCALHGWEFRVDDGVAVSPAAPFGLELRDVRICAGNVEIGGRR